MFIHDYTIKKTYLIEATILDSQDLHITITKELQKYTDLKQERVRIWQLKEACVISSVLSATGIIPNKLRNSFKPAQFSPFSVHSNAESSKA